MRKVLSFSVFLVAGLVLSQALPVLVGTEGIGAVRTVANILLYVCLGFIMINVGREFEVDKSRWKSYTQDYFIAMATAAMPWFLIALYYVYVLLPPEFWNSWEAWKENLLLSRFAAPTSAGILFTMLAAIGLKSSWIYKKIQVLAIFDDLDTILLMIPLQIMMIGLRWQLIIVVLIVFLLLSFGWKQLGKYNWRQDWKAILFYSLLVFIATQSLYLISKSLYGEAGSIHIEVLLPAFVVGMIMKHKEIDTPVEHKVSTGISFLFMFLVGMSMPHFIGVDFAETQTGEYSVTGSQEMMPWGVIILHVLIVSLLSNIGKLFPVFFYRDRKFSERLALSIGMFTRGEVGAGVIFIALGYNLGGPALLISVLTIVLNLILTGIFVLWVKKLALRSYVE
ncbi:sodium:proton antiporter [Bacteroides salyersiae]|uniref:sodium:proton antiporter n=1 Tax=Bacteroides salyersiae TaxID=291644 RepID=UPI001C8B6C1C|nr:sodium:proton antiporter [Bacteroides salyersiae]